MCALVTGVQTWALPISSPPVVVNLRSFEAPPEPVREVPEGPEKAERQEAKPEPKPDVVIPTPLIRLPVSSAAAQDMPEPMIEIVDPGPVVSDATAPKSIAAPRSEEQPSELQSLMRISYAVFRLQKKTTIHRLTN